MSTMSPARSAWVQSGERLTIATRVTHYPSDLREQSQIDRIIHAEEAKAGPLVMRYYTYDAPFLYDHTMHQVFRVSR